MFSEVTLFLTDYGEDALIDEYEDCVEHINKAVQANERILLHCEGIPLSDCLSRTKKISTNRAHRLILTLPL